MDSSHLNGIKCQTGNCQNTLSTEKEESEMKATRIGIDLAKSVFQIHGVDRNERKVICRRLKRSQLRAFFESLDPCLIGLEACGSAHYWARELGSMGHTVKLIAPQFVKPYVKGCKNDANDAEAICEAVGRNNQRALRRMKLPAGKQQPIGDANSPSAPHSSEMLRADVAMVPLSAIRRNALWLLRPTATTSHRRSAPGRLPPTAVWLESSLSTRRFIVAMIIA